MAAKSAFWKRSTVSEPVRSPTLLHEELEKIASGIPNQIAVVSAGRRVTFRELWRQVESVTTLLADAGIPDGSPVAICLSDPFLAIKWLLGVMKSGGVPALLPDLAERVTYGLSAFQKLEIEYVVASGNAMSGIAGYETGLLEEDVFLSSPTGVLNQLPVPLVPDQAVILFTSGTTGEPRPVLHCHRGMLFAASRLRELQSEFFSGSKLGVARRIAQMALRNPRTALRSMGHQTWMTDLAPSSIAGLTIFVQALYSGHTIVLSHGHLPREIFRNIQDNRVTMFATVPAVARAIANSNSANEYDLSSLAVIGVGGGFAPAELAEALRRRFRCEVAIGYGSTELGGGVLVTRPYDSVRARTTTVGRPFPGVSISIRGADGEECSDGVTGELWCKTPSKMATYLDSPESSGSPEDDWFRTHDLAVRDSDGAIRVIGRSDDMIMRGGRKIAPHEVEAHLMESGLLDEAVVAGVREPSGEDAIHAWVILKAHSGATSSHDLRLLVAQHSPPWCIPQHIHVVLDMPRTQSGEVSRTRLVRQEMFGELARDDG